MSSADKDVVRNLEGKVTGIQRGGIFEVLVTIGTETKPILARTSGRMKKYQIKIVVGDRVELEFSPYDLTQGRIVRRSQ